MRTRELFRVEGLPVLQNKTYSSVEQALASPVGDVVLSQDIRTGLVFNTAFDQRLLAYDEEYQNEQAVSVVFRRHLDDVMRIVDRHFRGRRLIEVGCGKGFFLERLRAAGYDAIGIDPAYEGESPHVVRALFRQDLGISGEGIVLRHVLEHVPDPVEFLRAIAAANNHSGVIYIEVPCFDWIRAHRAWFDIFYEHVNYFSLADFGRIFTRVIEEGHLFGGQYFYVVADLASLREPQASPTDAVTLPEDFRAGIASSCAMAMAWPGRQTAVWGASSKGVIFSNHLRRAGIQLDAAIDINAAKQQRYMASTGLKIIAPEAAMALLRPNSLVFVMNSNYYDEIISQSRGVFHYVQVGHHDV